MKRLIAATLTVIAITGGIVACGSTAPACAAPTVIAKGSSGGGSSGGGGGGRSSGGGSSSGSKSSGGSKSGGGSSSGSKSGASGQSKTAQQSQASANSKPSSKPSPETAAKAKTEAPKTVTRGGSYTSTVTGNTYVFHSRSYYMSPGYRWDIYDMYNPYNYWYMPTSPFYGQPYRVAGACGAGDHQVESKKENITINIDNDGKVVSAEDKNPKDPDLDTPVDADKDPQTTETSNP